MDIASRLPPPTLADYAATVRALSPAELAGSARLFLKLRIAADGDLTVCYAPFEAINARARVVIVGITPGRTQMINALAEARRQLDRGIAPAEASRAAKRTGANAERIAYFLGRKPRQQLSAKTDPDKLDAARRALRDRVARLGRP